MKAKYVKPALIMERFELTQSIASGCGAKHDSTLGRPLQWSKYSCGWDVGGYTVWLEDPICNVTLGENDEYMGVCYNNPDGGQSIFGS